MQDIESICNTWAEKLVDDMKASIHTAVGGEQTELEDSVRQITKVLDNGNVVIRLEMNEYWKWVDGGRRETKKSGPGAVRKGINKDWMAKKGINAREIILKIRKEAGLELPKKGLSYDKAVKQLSFLISRKIHRKGFKAKPFYNRVFNEDRLNELKEALIPVMKQQFIIELNGSSN